jgi:hypothetical protein
MAERTLLWDTFDYVFEADRRRIKPIRTYRNPIFLAREWSDAMRSGNFRSRRAFAHALGLSHARVSQVLGLLRLYPQALRQVEKLGDPLTCRAVTERKLRPVLNLPREKQVHEIRTILALAPQTGHG